MHVSARRPSCLAGAAGQAGAGGAASGASFRARPAPAVTASQAHLRAASAVKHRRPAALQGTGAAAYPLRVFISGAGRSCLRLAFNYLGRTVLYCSVRIPRRSLVSCLKQHQRAIGASLPCILRCTGHRNAHMLEPLQLPSTFMSSKICCAAGGRWLLKMRAMMMGG